MGKKKGKNAQPSGGGEPSTSQQAEVRQPPPPVGPSGDRPVAPQQRQQPRQQEGGHGGQWREGGPQQQQQPQQGGRRDGQQRERGPQQQQQPQHQQKLPQQQGGRRDGQQREKGPQQQQQQQPQQQQQQQQRQHQQQQPQHQQKLPQQQQQGGRRDGQRQERGPQQPPQQQGGRRDVQPRERVRQQQQQPPQHQQQPPPQHQQQQPPPQQPPRSARGVRGDQRQQPPQQQQPSRTAWGGRGDQRQQQQQPQQQQLPPLGHGGRGPHQQREEPGFRSPQPAGTQFQQHPSTAGQSLQTQMERVTSPPVAVSPSPIEVRTPPLEMQQTPSPIKQSALASLRGNSITNNRKYTPGRDGFSITVEVNHLRLDLGKLKEAFHYDVAFTPDKPKCLLREALRQFQAEYYPKNFAAFDGRKNLYAARKLPFNNDQISGTVTIPGENRDKEFQIDIKLVRTVDLTTLHDVMRHRLTPQEAIQCIDIVLRNAPTLTCIPVGRSFFNRPREILDLEDGMQMYNGFYQSAIRGWKIYLNVDVSHKAFPKDQPIIDLIKELAGRQPVDLRRELDRNIMEKVDKYLKALKVKYQIPNQPSSKRIYRVNGLSTPARSAKFTCNNKEITVEEYYRSEKRTTLNYPLLPTVWVGSRERENKVLLPVEFCIIEPGQVTQRKMTEGQTRNMIRYTATSTTDRKAKIMTSLNQANYNNDPCVREFGFSVSNKFESLDARVLTPPDLNYAQGRSVRVSKGQWRNERLFKGAVIEHWTIVSFDRFVNRDKMEALANMIHGTATRNGIDMTNPAIRPFEERNVRSVMDVINYFKTKEGMDLIFVIIPNAGQQYALAKKASELHVGCLTQCLKSKTVLTRCNDQTVLNILLKVNSKMNGTNHIWKQRPPIMNRPCMVMGADVTHPSPDARDIPSVAAVTASFDPNAFQYNICWRLQPPKTEIITDLEAITKEQLMYFYEKNRSMKPEKIVFFRDGVSEGQFQQVQEAEIAAIQRACKSVQKDGYEPQIVFLVVQKRHHTRLFPTKKSDSYDRNFNVPAGTCVDTEIVNPMLQDFYLVSHASIQGVAKPTKYVTLWDDVGLSNDDIQQFVYYLCHMFTRCNRSVSYPAPTYYAHLAAARGKVYIENERLNMNNLRKEQEKFKILNQIVKEKPMFFV